MNLLLNRLRGISRLGIDATVGVTDIVEAMHGTIASATLPVGQAGRTRTRGLTRVIYGTIRGTTRLVGAGIDGALGAAGAAFLPADADVDDAPSGWISALNGVCGDYLAAVDSPLALPMALIPGRRAESTDRQLLAIHGLCLNEHSWQRDGHNHPQRVSDHYDLDLDYLRYNTGLSIETNGRQLDDLMESRWQDGTGRHALDILAHSMGGLVARAALTSAQANDHRWLGRVRRVVCLGTPHLGAILEKGGNVIDRVLEVSPYSAPIARLGKVRSAGITGLREGRKGHESADQIDGIKFHAVAGRRRAGDGVIGGDGLVSVASALAFASGDGCTGEFTLVVEATDHFDLLDNPGVGSQLIDWLD